jgi:hypothetical protein
MPLETTSILTVPETRAGLGLSPSSMLVPGIRVWTDGVTGETAATAQALASGVLRLIITGGANAGTVNITRASFSSLTLLETEINDNAAGWNASVVGDPNAAPADLHETSALTGLSGVAAAGTLDVVDNEGLAQQINRATNRIDEFLGFQVITRTHAEYHRLEPASVIFLDHMPVTSLTRLAYRGREVIRIRCNQADAVGATARIRNFEGSNTLTLTITGGAAAGTVSIDLTALATNTVGEVATSVSAQTGWTGTASAGEGAWPASDLLDTPAWDCLDTDRSFAVPEWVTADYWIDEQEGSIHFGAFGSVRPNWGAWAFGPAHDAILVEYRAGWRRSDDTTNTEAAFVPYDIREAVLELVKGARARNAVNPLYRSETRGKYSYQLAATGSDSLQDMERKMLTATIGRRRKGQIA